MIMTRLSRLAGAAMLLCAAIATPNTVPAETLSGSNVDSRVMLGLAAPAEGIQALMPDGWNPVPFPGGPLKGANVLVVFIDGALNLDADGKPLDPPARHAVAVAGLGKQADGDAVRLYVLRIYTTAPESDPYGVNIPASISRTAAQTADADGKRSAEDAWQVETGDGTLSLELAYAIGRRSWGPSETFPHSAATPDFSRIYRVEQLTGIVFSAPLGIDGAGTFSLESSIPELAAILDGSEKIVAVLDVPVYVRKVFLP